MCTVCTMQSFCLFLCMTCKEFWYIHYVISVVNVVEYNFSSISILFIHVCITVVDFFNRINLIYGTVCEYCTETSCPTMSGGQKFEYLWADGVKYKKPTCLPASRYIALLMDWVETQINDEHVFPVTVGKKIFLNIVLIPYIQCKIMISMVNTHWAGNLQLLCVKTLWFCKQRLKEKLCEVKAMISACS